MENLRNMPSVRVGTYLAYVGTVFLVSNLIFPVAIIPVIITAAASYSSGWLADKFMYLRSSDYPGHAKEHTRKNFRRYREALRVVGPPHFIRALNLTLKAQKAVTVVEDGERYSTFGVSVGRNQFQFRQFFSKLALPIGAAITLRALFAAQSEWLVTKFIKLFPEGIEVFMDKSLNLLQGTYTSSLATLGLGAAFIAFTVRGLEASGLLTNISDRSYRAMGNADRDVVFNRPNQPDPVFLVGHRREDAVNLVAAWDRVFFNGELIEPVALGLEGEFDVYPAEDNSERATRARAAAEREALDAEVERRVAIELGVAERLDDIAAGRTERPTVLDPVVPVEPLPEIPTPGPPRPSVRSGLRQLLFPEPKEFVPGPTPPPPGAKPVSTGPRP